MWIGKTHPTKPVAICWQRLEPCNRSLSHPFGVVPLGWNWVDMHLRRFSIATAFCIDLQLVIKNAVVIHYGFWVVIAYPLRVVQCACSAMGCEFHVVKTTVRIIWIFVRRAMGAHAVFGEAQKWIEQRLKVCFANQCGCITGCS